MSSGSLDVRQQRERKRLLPPESEVCPIRDVLDHVGGRWPVLTLFVLESAGGTARFGQLRRGLQGVSQRMLAKTLRNLQRDGLILRRELDPAALAVEYSLTAVGRSLLLPLRQMVAWANDNFPAIRESRVAYLAAPEPGIAADQSRPIAFSSERSP